MASVLDWLSLSFAQGLGISGIWRLVHLFGGPEHILAAGPKELLAVPGIRASQVAGLSPAETLYHQAEQELARIKRFGAEVVCYDDDAYPELLRQTADPPPVLYVCGREDLLNGLCLAVVGSRAATGYGRQVAFSLAKHLAAAGTTVVSGLALGIDARAHEGALCVQGATVAVLGCGLDVVYPGSNRKIYQQIRDTGTLVSEYPLGTPPEGFRFPARNRIIAGMSRGVVVVEAAKRSGSLITAQLALDAGREVFAVPGRVDSFKSAGTHRLLKQGAKLVQTVEDIFEELQPGYMYETGGTVSADRIAPVSSDPETLVLLDCLDAYACTRDELITRSKMSAGRVNELLLFLELDGLVEILPTDEVRRLG